MERSEETLARLECCTETRREGCSLEERQRRGHCALARDLNRGGDRVINAACTSTGERRTDECGCEISGSALSTRRQRSVVEAHQRGDSLR